MFGFLKKKTVPKIQSVDSDNKNMRNSEQFCFNDLQEFMLYTALYKNGDKDIVWLKSNEYDKYWNDGFKLFDAKKYEAAIKSYQKCLNMNPISLYVKFEIAECYIQLKNYPAAMNMLMENVKHLMSDKYIAQFYRRIGFINIEVGNYDCAVACYVYSCKFENHPSIQKEIGYIIQQSSKMPQVDYPEYILRANNIIVIEKK